MPAMALLDRNGVYGSARFHTSATRNDIRAHVGAEISVSSLGPRLTPPAWLPHQHVAEPARLPLLCESREGYPRREFDHWSALGWTLAISRNRQSALANCI
jgi:error-prone DNA polymerase